ncbi:MAG: hypothetical protein RRB13_15385 [bacterium]|nr:hypothetical protein [bacterium]
MQPSHRIQVIFDEDLSEAEVDLRVQAIHLISGVSRIDTEASSTRVPGPQEGITIEPPKGGSGAMEAQRELIHKALLWGVSEGKLELAEIQRMSPEATIQRAMELIDQMPEWEKQQLSRDFSRKGGA